MASGKISSTDLPSSFSLKSKGSNAEGGWGKYPPEFGKEGREETAKEKWKLASPQSTYAVGTCSLFAAGYPRCHPQQ